MTGEKRDGIGVLGAGRWGTTLAQLAAERGRPVLLHTSDGALAERINRERANRDQLPELERLADSVRASADLAEVASRCFLLIIARPAAQLRATVRELGPLVDGSHLVVHAVRGFEPGSLLPPSRLIAEETCVRKIGAFVGPALSESLVQRRPNAAVVASRFPEVVARTQEALASDVLRLYSSRDLVGVETAGAASGVIALALGMCLELELGAATIAVLITRGTAEIARLCAAEGGQERTAFGLAGLGDLLVQREAGSQEIRAGRLMVRGTTPGAIEEQLGAVDAFGAVRTLSELARKRGIEAPMTAAVHEMVTGRLAVRDAVGQLMRRQLHDE